MAGTDLADIFLVVIKIAGRHLTVLISDQTVLFDILRTEFYLDLDILGNRDQRGIQLSDQNLLRLAFGVDIVVIAIAFVGQQLHLGILQIAGAEAEHTQKDAAGAFLFYQTLQSLMRGCAHIEIAIACQDHPVDTALDVIIRRHPIGQLNAGSACSGATG